MLSTRFHSIFRCTSSNSGLDLRAVIKYCSNGTRPSSFSTLPPTNDDQKSSIRNRSKSIDKRTDSLKRRKALLKPEVGFEPLVKTDNIVKENIFTIPNALCVSRIALSPLLGYFVVNGNYEYGLAIFVYAGLTDMMDGWIARTFPSQKSVLGSALDPLADKVLISVLVLSLTYVGLIPLPLTVLIVTRDVGLLTAGFIMRYITLERPRTLAKYFDLTEPSIRIKPTTISKFNTGVQLCMVGFSLAAPVFQLSNHPALYATWCLTAATTIASGLSYIFVKDTYEIVKKSVQQKSDESRKKPDK